MGSGGNVFRDGDTVLRPAGAHRGATGALLRALAASDFPAPVLVGDAAGGGQAFRWIEGEVAVAPFPAWAMSDAALGSTARLLRAYHATVAALELPPDLVWPSEMADPRGGPIVCHNDVCPENVVFRDGEAVALLDFDMAAPGRALWDLAQLARMWSPLRPPALVAPGMEGLRPLHRLGVLARAYGLEPAAREEFVEAILESGRAAHRFLRARLAAGEPAFLGAWGPLGGERAVDDVLAWLHAQRDAMRAALS